MKQRSLILLASVICLASCSADKESLTHINPSSGPRKFISHRGVNLGGTIAGENSLEAVDYAAMAGFDLMEFDVRFTSDSVPVVMHDATLNRTCTDSKGELLGDDVPLADKTFEQLRKGYYLKASRVDMRGAIPSLEEMLVRCRERGMEPVIDVVKNDADTFHFNKILDLADRIIGPGKYILASNYNINLYVRNVMHRSDVRLLCVLHKSCYDTLKAYGNMSLAIGTSFFSEEEYAAYVSRADSEGIATETHTDVFSKFDELNKAPISYVSTTCFLPDYKGQGTVVADIPFPKKWKKSLPREVVNFGGYYLEMTYRGNAEVRVGRKRLTLTPSNGLDAGDGYRKICFQMMIFQEKPKAVLTPGEGWELKSSRLRFILFE